MDAKTIQKIFEAGVKATLSEIFKACWMANTCNPDLLSSWKPESPVGQTEVTVLTINDLLGGEVMETQVNGQPYYYNQLLDGTKIDLTESQYSSWVPMPPGKPMDRDDLVTGPEAVRLDTSRRYNRLSNEVFNALRELNWYWQNHTDTPDDLFDEDVTPTIP